MKQTLDGKPTGRRPRKGRFPSSDIVRAVDEVMAGKWNMITVKNLKPGMRVRDQAGGEAELTGAYPSADSCMYLTFTNKIGYHVHRERRVLVRPNDKDHP